MSQSVNRLKELLFEPEANALAELQQRISQIDKINAQERESLRAQIDAVFELAGNTEKLTQSVADILDEALRRAEVEKHTELSLSIAPLVVSTIKTELKNSQDEMVEALYPITGRLVKAYVASAVKDLTEEMNRRLEMNPVMMRLQSLMTGRPVGELALAATQDFQIEELYLIRRGSGELIEHWPDTINGREHLMSGVLAAVNAFANEALSAQEGTLRQIDLGDETVYLRGSQLYLLAAKCSGTAPKRIEQTLDEAFLTTIERELYGDVHAGAQGAHNRILEDLGSELSMRVDDQKVMLRQRSSAPLKVLAALILLPIAGWMGWSYWVHYANEHTRTTAASVVASTPAMHGYPTNLVAGAVGKTLLISGLVPSPAIKTDVMARLGQSLPGVQIKDELAVVPGSNIVLPNTTPELNQIRRNVAELKSSLGLSAMRRSIDRATSSVSMAARDMRHAASTSSIDQRQQGLDKTATTLEAVSQDLTALKDRLGKETALLGDLAEVVHTDIDGLGTRIAQSNGALADMIGAAPDDAEPIRSSEPETAAESLAAKAERLSALTAAVLAANAVVVPEPKVVMPSPPKVDAQTRLTNFIARHAVFFTSSTSFRNVDDVRRILDELAALLRESNTTIRIVGYTDEAGNTPDNSTLAQARAEKVRQELISRNISSDRLITIGRRESKDISNIVGSDSPNRRVVFELTYVNEIEQ